MKDQSDSPGDKSDDKQRHPRSPLTVFKWVAVGTVVVLLAFVVAAKVAKFRSVRDSICCDCNLKEIGLSLRVFANDHSDKFPMQLEDPHKDVMEMYCSPSEMERYDKLFGNPSSAAGGKAPGR